MEYLKDFNIYETETSSYEAPKFIVKPYPGDTGYELTRKRYHRFLWVFPQLGKGVIDKGENSPVTEAYDEAKISGMGIDPDEKKARKLKKIIDFDDFINGDKTEK